MSDFLRGLGSALGGVTSLLSGGALIDAAGNALGLPPAITNAAKVAVGAMTGNVMLAADGAMGLAQELTKNPPATTEYKPPADSARACEGYARPPARDCSPPGTSGPARACGGTQGSHLDPKMNDYFHALQTLQQNFRYLDATDGKLDGNLSRGDLQRIAQDARVSPELRQAARFLVDNPGYFERLETSGGVHSQGQIFRDMNNDDRVSLSNIQNEIFKVKADFAQYGRPAGTGCVPSGSTGGTASSSMRGIINDPSMSLEEKIEAILMSLTEKMDGEILQVMDQLAAAQDKQAGIKNGKGDEKALADSQRDIERLNLRLQKLVEKRKMMFEMMSTLSMKFNEMAKTALSNMRSA
ncbi:MAG TPA: hypothetical protein VFZ09_07150 [Archangium sp.]|uniref:hypothetical protein n=1 Tax=Archangium sp. TaxID=1872627 RepID=UPI002E30BD7D|nr:hypothetical protein [Archangium sp.]HEX5746003.1 hypothetical protein [Archangium sp.]